MVIMGSEIGGPKTAFPGILGVRVAFIWDCGNSLGRAIFSLLLLRDWSFGVTF